MLSGETPPIGPVLLVRTRFRVEVVVHVNIEGSIPARSGGRQGSVGRCRRSARRRGAA